MLSGCLWYIRIPKIEFEGKNGSKIGDENAICMVAKTKPELPGGIFMNMLALPPNFTAVSK